jgi:hypothetical protein
VCYSPYVFHSWSFLITGVLVFQLLLVDGNYEYPNSFSSQEHVIIKYQVANPNLSSREVDSTHCKTLVVITEKVKAELHNWLVLAN